MSRSDDLWGDVLALFEGLRLGVDWSGQAALNRIASKCIGFSFDPTTCSIGNEVLDADALRRLTVFHDIATPRRLIEPIVVVRFKGETYVIDGNKRVNLWRGSAEPWPSRRAIVIKPTEAGYATWLLLRQ